MNLSDAQKQTVAQWINDGLKLADIQKRLGGELGVNLTYMEVRLLVDDLKLMPKDHEPPKPVQPPAPPGVSAPADSDAEPGPEHGGVPAPGPGGGVAVTVDKIAQPGAMVSGGVTFSDGHTAVWYMDPQGRLGVAPTTKGYKPAAADVQSFQMALEAELSKEGY